MKFLIDENIGQSVINYLKRKKYNILTAKEKFISLEDHYILKQAYKEKRIIITNDKDFGELIFREKISCYYIIPV